jgi:hypothetical protein
MKFLIIRVPFMHVLEILGPWAELRGRPQVLMTKTTKLKTISMLRPLKVLQAQIEPHKDSSYALKSKPRPESWTTDNPNLFFDEIR